MIRCTNAQLQISSLTESAARVFHTRTMYQHTVRRKSPVPTQNINNGIREWGELCQGMPSARYPVRSVINSGSSLIISELGTVCANARKGSSQCTSVTTARPNQ